MTKPWSPEDSIRVGVPISREVATRKHRRKHGDDDLHVALAPRIAELGLPERHTVEYRQALGLPELPVLGVDNRKGRKRFAGLLKEWARMERRALEAFERAKAAREGGST